VPISRAVQASAALPGLFPPVEIGDNYYVDGALKKTMHASVAMDGGIDLMLCLNPLVPFNATGLGQRARDAWRPAARKAGHPAHRGRRPAGRAEPDLPSMIHSRMELGMKHYERAYPGTDIVLIEPRRTAERILEVTLDLFNRFGEPNVSTTLISAELNISPGNLYYHYPAKDELINSAVRPLRTRPERAAATPPTTCATWRTRGSSSTRCSS
jgi:predicted acylesterase/phospholipase RssA